MPTHFETHVLETLGSIEAKVDALAGPEGRITKLERHVQWAETKQWIHTGLIIPVASALTALIRHLNK